MEGKHDRWLAATDAVLRNAGLRRAPGRAAVAAVLARGECLMSAADILRRLDDEPELSASSATVYRTLDLLHEHGQLRRIDAGDGPRYEPIGGSVSETHQHVILEDGTVEPFTDPAFSRAMAALDERLGVEVIAIELVVRARRRS